MVGGPGVTAGFPSSRILPKLHRGLAIDAQAHDLPLLYAGCTRYGVPVLFGDIGKDRVGFGEFFWGFALTTLRKR